ncbi:MAG: GNAT family N-acetyltransferase [Actinomycetes bacterium]
MQVVRLPDDQLGSASAVLARAFQDDPAWGWVIPKASRREALLPWLFQSAFEVTDAEVWAAGDPPLGCARWVPPGRPEVHVGQMLRAFVATPLRLLDATSRFLAYGRAVETMRGEAVPEPHWYLAGLGVHPDHRRQGLGATLLQPGFEASARDGIPCALLTNAEVNVRFYERHGFEVIREGETPVGGPRAWMMRRKP